MIKKKLLGIDVVEAAKRRIIQAFSKGKPVWLAISGGKDSIVLVDIVYNLLIENKINKNLLTVFFVDEEAMFDDVIDIVKAWRIKFLDIGVKFNWYCIQVKHFNCLNSMSEDETFVCWDKDKKDVWVRDMPRFAIKDDPFLIPYKDNYQSFIDRKQSAYNFIAMRGVRVSESIQRRSNIVALNTDNTCLPIYDFSDADVWLYILRHGLDFPKTYENLYRIGRSRKELRISQFFSSDTARVLVNLGEMYPDLMERIEKREPNAYLCALYWDSEMFGRSSAKRRKLEVDEEKKDYKAIIFDYLRDSEKYPHPELQKAIKNIILRHSQLIKEIDWKRMYDCMMKGDPKERTIRAISTSIATRRNDD